MFTNYLVMFSFRSFIKILVGESFQISLSHGDSRARASRSYIVSLVDHVLDRVDLKMEDRQEDLGILV